MEKVVTKIPLRTRGGESDYLKYWLQRPASERLNALEEICQEYNSWRYTDAEQRLQRVVHIIKQA